MRHVPINRNQRFKARLFGCREQFSVTQASQSCVAAGLTIVPAELMAQSLIDTFIQEEAHLEAGEQRFFRFFQSLQGHLPANRRKALKKTLQAVPRFEILEQCTNQNPCSSKRGFAGHDAGIANDNRLHFFSVPHFQRRLRYDALSLDPAQPK